MPTAKVIFHKLIQDSQDYGSNDDHMVSRVFFSVHVGDEVQRDVFADIKQTVGSDVETARLEVSRPHGYTGAWDHDAFAKAAERYFRACVGSLGSGIRTAGGGNIRMRNNTFTREVVVEFPVSSAGSW
jgi:hypothetical protein